MYNLTGLDFISNVLLLKKIILILNFIHETKIDILLKYTTEIYFEKLNDWKLRK